MPDDVITDVQVDTAELREIIGPAMDLAATKEMPSLDEHCRHFISLSPFLCLGTADSQGRHDVSPRGDPPGFVKVLDDKTILIPDRRGNRRVDSMINIAQNPRVGVLFLLPGVEETLRLHGRATIIKDAALFADMAVNGKTPVLGIQVEIDEVFYHCAKAIKRAKLWDPETPIDREAFPSYGEIIRDQRRPGEEVEPIEEFVQTSYKNEFY